MNEDLNDPRAFRWVEAGISGLPRTRDWDTVVTADCGASGDTCTFAVLPEHRPVHLGGDDAPLACLASALEDAIDAPYRAVGVRREAGTWAVGAIRIEVAELPADTEGEELMLTVTQEGERGLEVDGRPTTDGIAALERAARGRFDAYVLRATRLDGRLWEIGIDPL